jgi:16S rRNA A1518/A1519 N6-dimethyltransferase RsmA/KsgA/DIM1 with predicted DNA glycosylase/AP lyase activity
VYLIKTVTFDMNRVIRVPLEIAVEVAVATITAVPRTTTTTAAQLRFLAEAARAQTAEPRQIAHHRLHQLTAMYLNVKAATNVLPSSFAPGVRLSGIAVENVR